MYTLTASRIPNWVSKSTHFEFKKQTFVEYFSKKYVDILFQFFKS